MFKNLKLRARLLMAFGAVLLLSLALSAGSIWQLRSLKLNADELSHNWLPSVQAIGAVDTALSNYRLANVRTTVANSAAERDQFIEQARERRQALEKAIATYVPQVSSPEEAQLAQRLQEAAQGYAQDSERLAQLVRDGQLDQAREFSSTGSMRQHGQDVTSLANTLIKLNHDGGDAETLRAEQTYNRASIGIGAACALALSLGFGLAWHISGDLRRRVDGAATAAKKFAAGDLTHEFAISGGDEVADMLRAMASMRGQLSSLVLGVRQNAESVATASAQISQGNADLSSRTEQQASALQQTAASMEQINGTAQNNAENAAQASQLAIQASGVADEGSRVVDGVVQTMRQIEQASRQVEEIISVIDGIAFQTNILALNAAVEAARAGEQGRGFAVVAGEVRSLAQRSAEAARQVKQLIATSVERVASGTALVDEAGTTMREVKSAVQRVSDIVGEIAAGSREQMGGVGQVSEAVTNMDQTTQQNAALVEESAAAAESLRQQAQALVHAVATFRTDSAHAQAMAKPAAAAPIKKVAVAPSKRLARAGAATPADTEWASF